MLITQSIVDRCMQEKICMFPICIFYHVLCISMLDKYERVKCTQRRTLAQFSASHFSNSPTALLPPPLGERRILSNLIDNSLFRNFLAARGMTMCHSSSYPTELIAIKQLVTLCTFPSKFQCYPGLAHFQNWADLNPSQLKPMSKIIPAFHWTKKSL